MPLHWAALNKHLAIVQKLIEYPAGPGVDLINIKTKVGHMPLGEAELTEWDEGVTWLVKMINLEAEDSKEEKEIARNEVVNMSQDIEVEIQDADRQIAKITISGGLSKL
ncbi:hypothetical protein H2248_011978 [Termitomyces sp. 'cryptogamus']|nr:hypothetical protein H2248_011978 [Termitomyces sp. 'cryptogamus']